MDRNSTHTRRTMETYSLGSYNLFQLLNINNYVLQKCLNKNQNKCIELLESRQISIVCLIQYNFVVFHSNRSATTAIISLPTDGNPGRSAQTSAHRAIRQRQVLDEHAFGKHIETSLATTIWLTLFLVNVNQDGTFCWFLWKLFQFFPIIRPSNAENPLAFRGQGQPKATFHHILRKFARKMDKVLIRKFGRVVCHVRCWNPSGTERG